MKRRAIVHTLAVAALIQGAIWSLPHSGTAFAVTPPNDTFAAATDITADGAIGSVSGTNVDASLEPGEPDTVPTGSGNSVWYRWTAPTTTCVVFDIDSSTITHAVVSAFTGSSVNALTEVPRANHTGIDVDRLVFQAIGGTVYSVRVDGYTDSVATKGDFVLQWTVPGTGPPNDNFANAESIGNALKGSATGTNVDATPECGEPEVKNDGTIYANSGRSVWYQWTAPANVPMVFTTDGSSFDTLLAVYQGSAVNALTLVVSNDDLPDSVFSPSFVTFDAVAMQRYAIAVDGYDLASGATVLNWTPLPANDDFANATDITPYGATGMIVGDNLGGTHELGEPRHAGCDPGRSLWYRWTAPANGLTTFDTSGSLTNETVAVYTGSSIKALTPVLAVDGGQRAAFVTFTVAAGTSYRIAITGRCDGLVAGSFVLNWAPGSKPMVTQTATSTATHTPTNPATATRSATPTPSLTSTATRTHTPTLAPSPTPTLTQTVANTAAPTATNPATVTASATPTLSLTATATRTHTPTLAPSPTVTLTPTVTPTPTPTPTSTQIPTRTFTPPPTPTVKTTPTNTPTPMPTPSETLPTPPTPSCVGDCNTDREVTINEIVLMVNIALGSADNSACPNGIPAVVTVDISLIIQAVNNALSGCSGR